MSELVTLSLIGEFPNPYGKDAKKKYAAMISRTDGHWAPDSDDFIRVVSQSATAKKSYQILWYTHVMKKPITVKAHLSIETIETRYRKAKDPVERSHWQIIWLLAQGKTTKAIAEVTGYCPTWIRALAHRYNDEGPQGLGDRRHGNPGGTCLLSQEQQAQLHQALEEPPADGGLWTGPKVARWIESQTGRQVHPQRGWEYLKRLNYSKRVLRPRHAKADPAAQQAFKKTSRSR